MMPIKIVNTTRETIELSLPINPAYVSSARLTASSIANRMGFDIEYTEDIKSAVSEACAYLIHKKASSGVMNFKIKFSISERDIEICLDCGNGNGSKAGDEDEYGLKMIKALMDKAELTECEEGIKIIMQKFKA